MLDTSNMTVSGLCMSVAQRIGPVRSVSFDLLLELMLLNLRKSKTEVEELNRLFASFSTAKDTLENGMVHEFGAIGEPVPEKLEAIRMTTFKLISDAAEEMDQIRFLAEKGEVESELFADTATDLRTRLIPSIVDFLRVLQEVREECQEDVHDDGREVVRSAVAKIDTIALSIRMISLNASVEAAHAGEAGKGFAVIAQEIQNLSDEAKKAIDYIRSRLE